jgi:hypothetical protein
MTSMLTVKQTEALDVITKHISDVRAFRTRSGNFQIESFGPRADELAIKIPSQVVSALVAKGKISLGADRRSVFGVFAKVTLMVEMTRDEAQAAVKKIKAL